MRNGCLVFFVGFFRYLTKCYKNVVKEGFFMYHSLPSDIVYLEDIRISSWLNFFRHKRRWGGRGDYS